MLDSCVCGYRMGGDREYYVIFSPICHTQDHEGVGRLAPAPSKQQHNNLYRNGNIWDKKLQ